jgi:uncharacterized protein involved in exopolysaccharide biosynthesis
MGETSGRPGVLGTLWRRKWLILVPTLLVTLVTSIITYVMPVRYQAEATLLIVQPQFASVPSSGGRSAEHIDELTLRVTSRTKLERLIEEFDLYTAERAGNHVAIEDIIDRMRRFDIRIWQESENSIKVTFASEAPRKAMLVVERLANLLVTENTQVREQASSSEEQFIAAMAANARKRLESFEGTLDRTKPRSRADALEMEWLEENYKLLLARREEARWAKSIELRQIAEQFKVVDSIRLPEKPMYPDRLRTILFGGIAGLGLGLGLVVISAARGPGAGAVLVEQ